MKRWKLMAVALAAALLLTLCTACGKKTEEQTDGDGKPGSTQQDAAKDDSIYADNNVVVDDTSGTGGWLDGYGSVPDQNDPTYNKQGEPSHSGGNSGNTSAPDASQNLKWEEFYALSAEQKDAYKNSFSSKDAFFDWMVAAQDQFTEEHPTIEIGPDGSIDLSKLG